LFVWFFLRESGKEDGVYSTMDRAALGERTKEQPDGERKNK
jgi:hypothetical protein